MFILVKTVERDTSIVGTYPIRAEAIAAMKKDFLAESDLDATDKKRITKMDDEDDYDCDEFGFCSDSAWANNDYNYDWNIFKIPSEDEEESNIPCSGQTQLSFTITVTAGIPDGKQVNVGNPTTVLLNCNNIP